jgi:hypothetical protein
MQQGINCHLGAAVSCRGSGGALAHAGLAADCLIVHGTNDGGTNDGE